MSFLIIYNLILINEIKINPFALFINAIKLMLETSINHLSRRKKQSQPTQNPILTYKSPYFSSVRRNQSGSRTQHKMSAQNAIMITKYPSIVQQDISKLIYKNDIKDINAFDNLANLVGKKRKVFKRFSKFQQIDEIYTTDITEPKAYSILNQNQNKQPKNLTSNKRQHFNGYIDHNFSNEKSKDKQKIYSMGRQVRVYRNSRDIVFSSKTLALAQKYNSYKSIMMSTPKMPKDRDRSKDFINRKQRERIRKNGNFRTKTKSGNTIQWTYKQDTNQKGRDNLTEGQRNLCNRIQTQDWLCKRLIQNQVYGVYDDDCF